MSSGKPVAVVTGGAGFIGSHMVDALVGAGFAVRVIDNLVGGHRSNLDHLKGNPDLACYWQDIRQLEPDSPIFADAKSVFHFAQEAPARELLSTISDARAFDLWACKKIRQMDDYSFARFQTNSSVSPDGVLGFVNLSSSAVIEVIIRFCSGPPIKFANVLPSTLAVTVLFASSTEYVP